jgi:hypothetical protein
MSRLFDDLSKALARGTGRRAAIQKLVAGTAGAAITSFLPAQIALANTDRKTICQNRCHAKNGACVKECDQLLNVVSELCTEFCDHSNPKEGLRACVQNCESLYVNSTRIEQVNNCGEQCIGVCVNSTLINNTYLSNTLSPCD